MLEFNDFVLLKLGQTAITVGGVVTAIVILTLATVAAKLAQSGLGRLRQRHVRSTGSIYLAERLVTYGLVLIGAVVALSAMGLNLSSLAVFAGALGIGVGLGLQGVVKEFVSGLVLIFDRVLNVGDYIEIESGARGIVQEIGPRATRIRTNDNIDVLVPNSHLIEHPVVNWTLHGETRRIHIPFVAAMGADKVRVREAVLKAAHEVPFTLPDTEARKTQVWLTGFGDGAMNFELVVWPTLDAAKRPQAMHAAYTWAVEDALRCEGIEIPFPQREIRIRGLFGEEGEDALRALHLDRQEHARRAAPAPAPNDAVDDLIRSVEHEEPPPGAEPPAPGSA